MTVAETSVTAYHEMVNSGALTKRQSEVMDYMETVGLVTRRQVAKVLDWDTGSSAGRVNELVAMGVLEEYGVTKCPKTGNTVGLVRVPRGQGDLF